MSNEPVFDLADKSLFGSEAAEAESSDEVFDSYFFERSEFAEFTSSSEQLLIVNAYKGEGKSALLRAAEKKVKSYSDAIALRISSYQLSSFDGGESYDNWVRGWRSSMISVIAVELGKNVGFAWTEDDIRAVEQAEREGARERNIFGLIIDRFTLKLKLPGSEVELKSPNATQTMTESALRRQCEGKLIWLFIDDADVNFVNTNAGRYKVAGLLTASRQLCQLIPGLRIRTTVRPTTWSSLYSTVEDMTHIREYLLQLTWQTQDIRNILAKRIEAYLLRSDQRQFTRRQDGRRVREEQLVALLFGENWQWAKVTEENNGQRPAYVVLSNLSKDRPRWLIELCKEAAKIAVKREATTLTKEFVIECLADFGRRRLANLVNEFSPECGQVETLLNAFSGQRESYKTDQLLQVITNRITNLADIRIAGEIGRCDAIKIGHFLFKIGFLTARIDFEDGGYEHLSFSQKPSLLRDKVNLDQGCSWEIHPVFRQALGIRDYGENQAFSRKKWSGKERK